MPVVMEYCDRLAVMRHGRIVETGEKAELRDDPRHPYTKKLLSSFPSVFAGREHGEPELNALAAYQKTDGDRPGGSRPSNNF